MRVSLETRLKLVVVVQKIIDQGLKFRALTYLGLGEAAATDIFNDQDRLGDFLVSPGTQIRMLELLGTVADMKDEDKDELLYSSDVSNASRIVGQNPNSHPIAISLLFDEVFGHATNEVDTVLVDGRCMEKYGRQMAERHIAQYVMGFYVRCDSSVAATRSLGKIIDHKEMSLAQKDALLEEITRIRDRNRADTLRGVDAMREPHGAYALSLHDFVTDCPDFVHGETLDALLAGMVTLDTSYTKSISEMTGPVIALATHALGLQDQERERFTSQPHLWESAALYGDPRRQTISRLPQAVIRVAG